MESPNIVPEAEILSVGADDDDSFHGIDDLGEFSISRIINQHAAGVLALALSLSLSLPPFLPSFLPPSLPPLNQGIRYTVIIYT